jgi:multiple sugar transport system substrate-binding protein
MDQSNHDTAGKAGAGAAHRAEAMTRRRVLAAAGLAGTATAALVGCGTGQQADSQVALYSGQQTTVIAAFAGAQDEHDLRKAQVEAFAKKRPKIAVQYEVIENTNRFGWLTARFAAGTPPDHVWTTDGYHHSLVARGGLMNLTPYVRTDKEVKPEAYFKDAWSFLQVDGKLTAVPAEIGPMVLYYSPAQFEKAGASQPTDPWTWDDWLGASQRIVRANGEYSGIQWAAAHWFWASFVLTNGGSILDKEGKRLTINTPEGREAFQFIVDLIHRHRVMAAPGMQIPPNPFQAGATAMQVAGAFTLARNNDLARQAGFRYDVVRFPRKKIRTTAATMVQNGVAAPSKVPEATWELVKFLASREGLELVAQKAFALPALNDAKLAETFAKSNPQPMNVQAFFEQAKDLNLTWLGPKFQDMLRELNDAFGPMWRGERPSTDVLKDAEDRVNRNVFGAG